MTNDNTAEQLKRCPMCSCTRIDLVTTYPHAFTLMLAYECNACGVRTKWCANDVEARKMWNTRADSGEAVAWLVESEKAGRVSSELHELSADKVIADVVREYGDAYGATTKRPLFTHPRRVTADEVRDASRLEWLDEQVKQGTRIEFAKGLFGNSVEIGLRSPPRAFVQDTVRDAIDVALARCGEGANGRR
jgi:hypothetical protein